MRFALLAVVATAFVSVACTSVDPYTGEQKASNSTKGAATGAVVGAVIGAIVNHDDREKGALIGAAAGAGTGAGVGYYMDRQEAVLRQRLEGTGVRVERTGDNINLVMPGNITFETNRYDIRSDFNDVLTSVAVVLAEYKETDIAVSGYTDSTGSFEYNQQLSEQRAGAVANFLAQQGVAVARISSIGFGPRNPVASNATADGRAQNRRVELKLVPISKSGK